MWRVRPACIADLPGILALVSGPAARGSSLPRDDVRLSALLTQVEASFAGEDQSAPPRFLFVLETTDDQRIVGTAGIDAVAGNGQPFYNYRRDELIHASRELAISTPVEVLYLTHELTAASQLCAFTLDPALGATSALELLSRARLLYMALHPEVFAEYLVAELPGIQDDRGESPFWDSLGRHFFAMNFATADRLSAERSKTFIAELMPPHPIYVTLLSEAAQAAMACHHPSRQISHDLLWREGFRPGRHIDIFDAGPVLEAASASLQTLQCLSGGTVADVGSADSSGGVDGVDGVDGAGAAAGLSASADTGLVATGKGLAFRVLLAPLLRRDDQLLLTPPVQALLGVQSGDPVHWVPLNGRSEP